MKDKGHRRRTTGRGVRGKLLGVGVPVAELVEKKSANAVSADGDDVGERTSFRRLASTVAIHAEVFELFSCREAFQSLHKFSHALADAAQNVFGRTGNARLDGRDMGFQFIWIPEIATSGRGCGWRG